MCQALTEAVERVLEIGISGAARTIGLGRTRFAGQEPGLPKRLLVVGNVKHVIMNDILQAGEQLATQLDKRMLKRRLRDDLARVY